jgi:hypothetical protein
MDIFPWIWKKNEDLLFFNCIAIKPELFDFMLVFDITINSPFIDDFLHAIQTVQKIFITVFTGK